MVFIDGGTVLDSGFVTRDGRSFFDRTGAVYVTGDANKPERIV